MAERADDARSAESVNKMTEKNNRIRTLGVAVAGVFAALIFLATYLLKIPLPFGYANMGDGVILVCAFLMGPAAFFPAALGSALADLAGGYMWYIPATFVIKGLMGLLAGLLMKGEKVSVLRRLAAFVLAEIVMVGGYFLYEAMPFMYGPAAAAANIPYNCGQGAVGIVAALVLTALLAKQRGVIRTKLLGRF